MGRRAGRLGIDVGSQNRPVLNQQRAGLAAATGAVILWAVGNILVRLVPMEAYRLAAWRLALAGAVYWVVLIARRKKLTWEHLRISAPAGLALGADLALFFSAIKTTTIANATVIGALQPLVILVISARFFREKIGAWLIVMTVVATAGAGVVVLGSSGDPTWSSTGDLLAVGAMLALAAYFALAKKARALVPAHEFQTAAWLVATLVLLPGLLFLDDGFAPPTSEQWGWLLLLLLGPASGHLLLNWAHPRLRLSTTSILTLSLPPMSVTLAAVWLKEDVTPLQVGGIAVVAVTLGFIIRHQTKRTQTEPEAL